jgi:glycosyltransferase involved in cell wall biosynthesis
MRFHLVGFPHTQTIAAQGNCAYTQRNRKWASMMTDLGHEVFLYAGDRNEARCTELVTCITSDEQEQLFKGHAWYDQQFWAGFSWDDTQVAWRLFIRRAIDGLAARLEPHDFILISAGWAHRAIRDAFPSHIVVEPGVGYQGTCAPYRVFESYAWMHAVYATQTPGGASASDGRFFDTVIPNFFELEDFPAGKPERTNDYLFMSRMTRRKGYEIAIRATDEVGAKLIVCDTAGDRPKANHVEYVGYVEADERARLLTTCRALFCPTIYVEPFGGVVVEAQLCGTPVIVTDWGAFPELVRQGIDGYRCRSFREFVEACLSVGDLNQRAIRKNAIARWSTAAVGPQFERYFERLMLLWGEGFWEQGMPAR